MVTFAHHLAGTRYSVVPFKVRLEDERPPRGELVVFQDPDR
jgi:hypothetical protein